ISAPVQSEASAEARSDSGSLIFTDPQNELTYLSLPKDINMVGRRDPNRGINPDVDLTPFDKEGKVSRRHAFIHREGDQFFLLDFGSTNGTFINDEDRLDPN